MRKMCYLFLSEKTQINKLFLQKQSFALYTLKEFTMKELLEKLENNSFIDKVRMDLEFDVKDYQEL